jgi:hypothetical protein
MNEELKALLSQPTASIPDVGRICFGLSRNGSYAAAADGGFPTIKVGKKTQRVPTAALRKMLGLEVA